MINNLIIPLRLYTKFATKISYKENIQILQDFLTLLWRLTMKINALLKGIIKFWNMPSYLHGSIEVKSRIIFDLIHTCQILQF